MILKQGDSLQYLLDVKDGKIKQGLGIDCFLDEHLRFKPKQLNIILGHDNVGKTYWINWYFLTLALPNNHKMWLCVLPTLVLASVIVNLALLNKMSFW